MNNVKKYFSKVSFFDLYLLIIFFILFERIPILKINITPYRIFVGLILLFLIIEIIKNKKIYLSRMTMSFMFFLIFTSLIGLRKKNISVFMSYIFMCLISLILYNLLIRVKINFQKLSTLSFILSIVMFIGSITLLTDYFGITRISAVFGEHIFQEMRSGRGAGLLGGESNITAARLSSILPFSIYNLIYIKKGLNRKLFILLSVIITILAIVLTGSRMGLLVLGFICLVIGLKEIRTSKFLVKFVVIIILISTMLLINFSMNLIKDKKFEERFESIQDIPKINKIRYEEGESSIMLRYFLFFIGIDLIKKNPLLGVGIGNSKYLTVKYTQEPFQMRYLHNTYLDICSENGIIMLIILLLFLSGIVIICYSRYKKEKNEFYFYFLVAFFVQLICWFFLSDFLNKLFWSLFLPVGLFLKNYGIEK